MWLIPAIHAQAGDEAREEDGLAAVTAKEALRARQHRLQAAEADEELPPVDPADPVADVVAEDRPERGEHDHLRDPEVATRGEHARRDERGLARHPDPGRLEED